jgi:hypothetical protein
MRLVELHGATINLWILLVGNVLMRKPKIFLASIASLFATSCATIPPIDEREYVKVADILYSVECELRDAIYVLSRDYPFVRNQLVSAAYQLKVAETGEGSGDSMIVVPISNGTFSIGFAAGLKRVATRDTNVTVEYMTSNLECRPEDGPGPIPNRIEGGIGLYSWLMDVSSALQRASETPVAMSYKVQFDLTANGSVTPKFGIQKTSGHQYGGSLKVSGVRERLHSVSISVAEIKQGNIAAARRRLDQEVQQFLLRDLRD